MAAPCHGISTAADLPWAASHGPLPGDRETAPPGRARLCGDTAATWGPVCHGHSRRGTGTVPSQSVATAQSQCHTAQGQPGVTAAPLWLLGPAPKTLLARAPVAPEVEGRTKSLSGCASTDPRCHLPRAPGDPHAVPAPVSLHIPGKSRVPRAEGPRQEGHKSPPSTRGPLLSPVPVPPACQLVPVPGSTATTMVGQRDREATASPTALPTPRVWAVPLLWGALPSSTHARRDKGLGLVPGTSTAPPGSHLPKPCPLRPA